MVTRIKQLANVIARTRQEPPSEGAQRTKTKVMEIGHIVSEPDLVCFGTESREELRARMDQARCDYAIGLSRDTNFLGVVSREQLDRPGNSDADGLRGLLDHSITPVLPDTSLDQVLSLLTHDSIPLPVVDGSNNFIGVATQKDLLKVVASGL